MEKFDDLMVNRRYLLVQGGNKAIETARRDAGQFVFQASTPVLQAPAAQARIPLMTPMPVAALPIRNFLGKQQNVKPGVGGPVLVTLWASWCSTCKAELTEFTQRAEDLQKAGIGVLALSVDGLGDERSDPAKGKKLLDELQFPFPVGFATRELVQMFQEIHDFLIPLKLPLPVPTSFLIDQGGQVSVIYKGRVKVDDLIRDSARVSGETGFDLGDIAPLPGRTIKDKNLEEVFRQNKLLTLSQRGVSLADNNRHGEAISYYLKALELQPASYKIHYNLGLAYYKSNSIDSAVHHIGRAIELQPQFLLSRKVMGELQLLLGNNDRAKEHYRQYLQGVPEDVEAINAQAVIATRTGDPAGAEESLKRAIDLNPTYVEARYNLGTILLMQRRMKEAEDSFLRILTIEPHYPDVLYNLGYLAELSGDTHRAANLYTGELRNHPASVKALSGLARIMEKHGDYTQAKNYYDQALALRPDYTPAQEGLKRISQQIGQGQ
jgi:tetratricopeptide (TPR) repeat protein